MTPNANDREIDFDRGVDTPLRPLNSTRWRSGPFFYKVDAENSLRYTLYVINPTDQQANGQIRLSTGGQVGGNDQNVDWERCQTFSLGAREARQVDLKDLDPEGDDENVLAFVEVDTGSAVEAGPNECFVTDPLGGSVVAMLVGREGTTLDLDCDNPGPDFAEPVFSDPLHAQGLRLP